MFFASVSARKSNRTTHGAVKERPLSRAERYGVVGFSLPIRLDCDKGPILNHAGILLHAICKARNKHSPQCLYLGWHCDSRSCRIVLAATAANKDLHDLVDDEQGEG